MNYIIGIDPAGIGSTGIVLWNFENSCIEFNETIISESVEQAIFKIKKLFDNFKRIENFKPLFIIENFFLTKGRTITNPLATSELIGTISSLLRFKYHWHFLRQESSKKKGFFYKGNLKLTKHEHDAWKHIQYFLGNEVKQNVKSTKN
ncbi:hypothetical protein [Spiroplasma endosymbiont of Clivina fossor]|uniref:hypothetical protein n=1 Tax=Spiroplasma endosymbiont of Clivina fossor TaxID=3066282 RepID=UPI00313C5B84